MVKLRFIVCTITILKVIDLKLQRLSWYFNILSYYSVSVEDIFISNDQKISQTNQKIMQVCRISHHLPFDREFH